MHGCCSNRFVSHLIHESTRTGRKNTRTIERSDINRQNACFSLLVIPAKAGIQLLALRKICGELDPSFRWDDEIQFLLRESRMTKRIQRNIVGLAVGMVATVAVAALAQAADAGTAKPLTMTDVLAASKPADWHALDPENTLYLELPVGRVVIELSPAFA